MRHSQHLETVKAELFNIFMHIEVEEQEQRKKQQAERRLKARREIEKHMENKQLQAEIIEPWERDF
ncbi:hypothetical protein SAMN05421831_1159 [Allopseudospirillum japonicum]|uniref:Uncharacterized protein n=1 Tax=Allopseudospirillum japonicum TaxID=64971 RepID=A0A1H6UE37_9GAMM|nr:hypothetical protein [Allopseudospirillum japonicum]SEI87927.1 hypothetical protein SAMN05421831_1159 [Allopseudospirillum japonicum]